MNIERSFDKEIKLNTGEPLTLLSISNVISVEYPKGSGHWDVDERIPSYVVEQILKSRDSSNFLPTDDDVRKHMAGDILTLYVSENPNRVVGFDAINFVSPEKNWAGLKPVGTFPDKMGVYFAGALIDGEMQKSGLYTLASIERVRRGIEKGYHIVSTETQNPRVEAGVKDTLDEMKRTGEIKNYSMNQRVLFKGLYGRCMYKEIPTHDKISYDKLDYDKGDAYALVFNLVY